MKRIISALAVATLVASSLAACGGDDDDSSGGTAGTKASSAGAPASSNGGDTSAPAGGDATVAPSGGAGSSENVMCDPAAATTCQDETDCPFVADGTARTTAQTCGKGCLGGSETCARDCITKALPMTDDCAGCYADFVNCTIANCALICYSDPNSAPCLSCQVDMGCRATFDTCSGLPD